MNGNKLLLDTNAIIFHLNGSKKIEILLEGCTIFISSITYTELFSFAKLTAVDTGLLKAYIAELQIVHTNNFICDIGAEIRRKTKIKLPDAIVAATSIYLDVPIITFDKGFQSINKLRIITPLV